MAALASVLFRSSLEIFSERYSFQVLRITTRAISALVFDCVAVWNFANKNNVSEPMNQDVPRAIPFSFYRSVSVSRINFPFPVPTPTLIDLYKVIEQIRRFCFLLKERSFHFRLPFS
jgi:hypothetical protein